MSGAEKQAEQSSDLVGAAKALRDTAAKLREVHALSADGDPDYDGHMLGQIEACERGANLLTAITNHTAPADALREVFTKTCKNAEPRRDGVLLHATDWMALRNTIDAHLAKGDAA